MYSSMFRTGVRIRLVFDERRSLGGFSFARSEIVYQTNRFHQQMAPDYDHLMLQQKVEVFEHALELTPGDDLAQILWFKSPSAEVRYETESSRG